MRAYYAFVLLTACRPITQDALVAFAAAKLPNFNCLRNGDWREDDKEATSEVSTWEVGIRLEEALNMIEGTPAYLPREALLSQRPYDQRLRDAWALGCLMSFLLNGKPLFYGSSEDVLLQMEVAMPSNVASTVRFSADIVNESKAQPPHSLYSAKRNDVSPDALDLLDRLLDIRPEARLTVSSAVNHDFLTHSGAMDPLTLYLSPHPSVKVSPAGSNVSLPSSTEGWARRQLSVVWAPMPAAYKFTPVSNLTVSGGDTNFKDTLLAPDVGIPETEVERGAYF